MDILVLGAGAWGTALAISAGARHRVTLWARDPVQAAAIAAGGENAHYLPGFALPTGVRIASRPEGSPGELAQRHDLVIVATPMAGLREMLAAVAGCARPVAWLCKGFEAPLSQTYGLLGHEIRAEVAPGLAAGALSGPSSPRKSRGGSPRPWSPPAIRRWCATRSWRPSTALPCASMPTRTCRASKSAGPSRTCWPSRPACAMAWRSA